MYVCAYVCVCGYYFYIIRLLPISCITYTLIEFALFFNDFFVVYTTRIFLFPLRTQNLTTLIILPF